MKGNYTMANKNTKDLERKKFIKNKHLKWGSFVYIFIFLLLSLTCILLNSKITFENFMLFICCSFISSFIVCSMFNESFNDEFDGICSEKLVDENLSQEEMIEVTPSKFRDYINFINSLNGTYYAFIDAENNVKIYVTIEGEEKDRYFETVSKRMFTEYYKLK